ncbi:MAG: prolyl oligopeptidase family serine peptidase [Candidatus Marinimicrobia bacterium]|nr:prolyl oligopeptidase family serine peptidase [Candidatus Neomarinimicrobiota bacterium]
MKRFYASLLILIFIGCQNTGSQFSYPHTNKIDHVDVYHGQKVADPYRWLEDDMSPETADWVTAQNRVTFKYLNKIRFRQKLKRRIEELNDYEKVGAPFKEGGYEYFYKNTGLQNHSILYRTLIDSDDDPEAFLDPNTFSEDGTVALRGVSFTKDASLATYMITEGGSDWRKIIVINTETREILEDTLIDVKFSGVSWRGNDGFYYSSYDNSKNTSALSAKTQLHKLFFHKLGTAQSEDKLIYGGEKQPNRYIGGYVTEDQDYLVISAAQNTSGNQIYVKNLNDPASELVQLQDDYLARCRVVNNDGGRFYLYTNIEAPNYRMVSLSLSKPSEWTDVIPESDNVLRIGSGGGYFFANYLVDAKTQIKQFDMDGALVREVALPGIGSAGGFGAKKEEKELYYSFSSYTYPSTTFKYDIESGTSTLYRQPDIDFEPQDYMTEQVFYKSKDSTSIPMFITYKKGLDKNGENATILYGYGGFNISMTPRFSATNIVWLENGGVYAVANLRGGGEYGEKWHAAGTKMNKQNVFDDFISAGEFLIANNYTSSDYLAIRGGSNGGLLVGATLIQRPALMKVAIPAVGVMDMLRYHQFTAGAGWAADYGTADESEEMFEYIRKYSPVHALKNGVSYPATLVTTADHDDRVVPAHSFKFAARLQEAHIGDYPVMIRIQTKAGHGSVSMEQRIQLSADIFAFIWKNMGVTPALR